MDKCNLSMLETIHEEEDSRACQNESIFVEKVSVEVNMIAGRDDISQGPNQVDKLKKSSLDGEDDAVVIVDLVDIVCNKQRC